MSAGASVEALDLCETRARNNWFRPCNLWYGESEMKIMILDFDVVGGVLVFKPYSMEGGAGGRESGILFLPSLCFLGRSHYHP